MTNNEHKAAPTVAGLESLTRHTGKEIAGIYTFESEEFYEAADVERWAASHAATRSLVVELARELVAGYPDMLPGLYCNGKPVGKMLIAAVRSASATKMPQPIGMVVKATFGDHKILVATKSLDAVEIGTPIYLATPSIAAVRAAAMQEAAKLVDSMHERISDPLLIGEDRAEAGHNTLTNVAAAIRALIDTPAADGGNRGEHG